MTRIARIVFRKLHGTGVKPNFRSSLPPADCAHINDNFWASPAREPRFGEGEDGVEAYLVGTSHIEKTTSRYLTEVERSAGAVRALFDGAVDPFALLWRTLETGGSVTRLRAARDRGRIAGGAKAVCWNNVGQFLLLPHEDVA